MNKYLIISSLLLGGMCFQPVVADAQPPSTPVEVNLTLNSTFENLVAGEYPHYGTTESLEITFWNADSEPLYPAGTPWGSGQPVEPYYLIATVPPGIEFLPATPTIFPAGWTYSYLSPATIHLIPNVIIGPVSDPPTAITQFHIPVALTGPVNDQPYSVMFMSTGLPYTVASGTTISSGGDITVQGVPLPVSFSGFTAKGDGCAVNLDWTTAIEVNNKLFQVERSANGKTFEAIAEVKGAGNSNQPVKYAFVDKAPLNGHNFYRIRQIDFDGKSKYSAIEQVQVNCYEENIRVYPNPAEQVVYISGLRDQTTVEVYDVSGKRVLVKETQGSTEGLNLSGLASGTYHVRITKGEALLLSTPLVIKK